MRYWASLEDRAGVAGRGDITQVGSAPAIAIQRLRNLAVAAVAITAMTVTAQAQSPAIKQRQDIFGSFGAAVKEPGSMLRQEAPFDLEAVKASLKKIAEGAPKLKTLFPDDSKSGGYTEALPVVWEKKDKFLHLIDALAASANAAANNIKDEATFRTEWGKVSTNCRACHKVYRTLPKS